MKKNLASIDQKHNVNNLMSGILKDWKKIIMLLLSSFLFAFGTIIFLVQANTIPSGLSSIPQTLLYFFSDLKPYVTLIYFALNIPLIIFFWNKVKKSFLLLSLIFMFLNAFWGFILGEYGSSISQLFIIINNWTINDIDQPGYTTWPIFVYVSLAILINSFAASLAWKSGASTGGTDIIAYYFSTKLKKDVGNFLWIISLTISFFSIISLFFGGIYDSFFGIRTICSIFYIIFTSFIINQLYPKYRKVLVKIDSKKYKEITNYLNDINYWHGFKIFEATSGYTKEKNYTIESVMLVLEYKEFRKIIIHLDPNAWITCSRINDLFGNFNFSKIEK
ncbi:MAG: YitT family protein [Mycoplasmataceae bacterium]|nr:YitT family protein [Mycoplasmataceae bacterium]